MDVLGVLWRLDQAGQTRSLFPRHQTGWIGVRFSGEGGGAACGQKSRMPELSGVDSIVGREIGAGVSLLGVDIRNISSEHAPDGLVALTSRQVHSPSKHAAERRFPKGPKQNMRTAPNMGP
jgi:hypothetical protein